MNETTIDVATLLWVADEVARDRARFSLSRLRNAAFLAGMDEVEVMIRACAERVQCGGSLRPTSELMDA